MWLLLLLLSARVVALPKRIRIGGLFEEENQEQELAFRVAVDKINADRIVLPRSQLVALVERIEDGDSFDATQKACWLLSNGTAAIFGPQHPLTGLHVGSISDELEVPHVETSPAFGHRPDVALSVNLHPSETVLADSYVNLVDHYGWRNFTLLYEGARGIVRLHPFLKEAHERDWKLRVYRFEEGRPYRDLFWELKKELRLQREEMARIVLDVNRTNLFEVLKQAQQVGMMTEHQQYLITSLDMHTLDLSDFKYSKAKITGVRLVQESSNDYRWLLQSIMSRSLKDESPVPLLGLRTETALMYDAVQMFALALRQLDAVKQLQRFPRLSCDAPANKGTDGTSIINYMKSGDLNGVTGLVTFGGQRFRSDFQLDLMFLQEDGLVKFGEMVSNKVTNITRNVSMDSYDEQHKFVITTILNKPYVMHKNSSRKLTGNERYEGFCIDLIQELAKHLQFSYEIRLVKDGEFGVQKVSKWTGMIGEVMRGEADMAVASLSINSKREQAVDFTHPFMNTGISILYKKPTTTVTSLFSFLSPFSSGVWSYLMATFFGVSLVTFLVGRLTPYEWINPYPCRQDDIVVENIFNVRNSLWFNIGSLMQQGSELVPTAISTRTAASFWSFFTLIMVSSYTANLAAFLTVEKRVYPFHNVEELAAQNEIKYGCLKTGATRAFFEDSKIDTYKKIWGAMDKDESVFVADEDEGIRKVLDGNYAFFMEETTIRFQTERQCSLGGIGGLLDSKGYGIAVTKGKMISQEDSLTSFLSSGILQLQQSGIIQNLYNKWWIQKGGGRCIAQKASKQRELGLGNVGGVFVVLIFGMGVAVLIALLEFRWKVSQWLNPNQDSFWTLLKREMKFAMSFNITEKPVPQLKKKRSHSSEESGSSAEVKTTP